MPRPSRTDATHDRRRVPGGGSDVTVHDIVERGLRCSRDAAVHRRRSGARRTPTWPTAPAAWPTSYGDRPRPPRRRVAAELPGVRRGGRRPACAPARRAWPSAIRLSADETAYILGHCGAGVLITTAELYGRLRDHRAAPADVEVCSSTARRPTRRRSPAPRPGSTCRVAARAELPRVHQRHHRPAEGRDPHAARPARVGHQHARLRAAPPRCDGRLRARHARLPRLRLQGRPGPRAPARRTSCCAASIQMPGRRDPRRGSDAHLPRADPRRAPARRRHAGRTRRSARCGRSPSAARPIAPDRFASAIDRLGPILTQIYGSTEVPHPVTVLQPGGLPAPRRRRAGHRGAPCDRGRHRRRPRRRGGARPRRAPDRGPARDGRLLRGRGGHRADVHAGGVLPLRGCRGHRPDRPRDLPRPGPRRRDQRRDERLPVRGRAGARRPSCGAPGSRRRWPGLGLGRGRRRLRTSRPTAARRRRTS